MGWKKPRANPIILGGFLSFGATTVVGALEIMWLLYAGILIILVGLVIYAVQWFKGRNMVTIEVHPNDSSMSVSGKVSMQGMLDVTLENAHDHTVQVRKLEVLIKSKGKKRRKVRSHTELAFSMPPSNQTQFSEGIMLAPKETKKLFLCFQEKGDFRNAGKNVQCFIIYFQAVGESWQLIKFNPVSWDRAKQGGTTIQLHKWWLPCR